MDELNKLSLINEFAEQMKKLPEAVSSFNAYLQSKYDLEDLKKKRSQTLGLSEPPIRRQLAY